MSSVTLEPIIKTFGVSHYYAGVASSPKATMFIGEVAAWNEQPKVCVLERSEDWQWNAWER